ncbi:hypothetical protein GCM10007389_16920 [Pontibacter akesuensis]|nr:hypothetical protein GCM10007389_16920 [Pontibacter akesuensis]
MGCFWSPDALFGSIAGVVRTRVGYAGGTTPDPTYWALADHIETVQLDFDPAVVSYQDLLQVFFTHHKATRTPWKRQYASAIFFHDAQQERQAQEAKKRRHAQLGQFVYTEIYSYKAFHLAEDRHQKYKLQRHPQLWSEFQRLYPNMADLIHSTAAAWVNGYLYGYGQKEHSSYGLSPAGRQLLLEQEVSAKPVLCGS